MAGVVIFRTLGLSRLASSSQLFTPTIFLITGCFHRTRYLNGTSRLASLDKPAKAILLIPWVLTIYTHMRRSTKHPPALLPFLGINWVPLAISRMPSALPMTAGPTSGPAMVRLKLSDPSIPY